MLTGLALNAPEAMRGPRVPGSNTSITSARPPVAPMGNPPPMILPNAVRSGSPP